MPSGRRLVLAVALVAAQARAGEPLVPPEVVSRVAPAYPEGAPHDAKAVEVTLLVTVDKHGHVTKTEVATSGGRVFDVAAAEAVAGWTFSPARRGDRAIDSRIRVVVGFPAFGDLEPRAAPSTPAHAATSTSPPPVADADLRSRSSEVTVLGHLDPPARGAGDFKLRVGALGRVPRRDAAQLLTLAPGIFLANEGGQGHPYQVYLRGFDAREGQDLEFTANGVPVNDVGNVHGNGLADTHFIIPELVEQVRVMEGPFDPRQGNFAVAGSAAYELGLAERGVTVKLTRGSFGTERALALWGPESHGAHTFGGVEVARSDGYGANRKSSRATAMAGYEASLGKAARVHVLATSYAAHYGQAGVLRDDDVRAGRVGFYGTYDDRQGGDSTRHSVSARFEEQAGHTTLVQQVFVVRRGFRLRANYTGYLEDAARGDLIDETSRTTTLGARGSARTTTTVGALQQALEVGFLGRTDSVDSEQRRLAAGTGAPYRTDLSLESALSNLAMYADASLRLTRWLAVRGGVRGDYFHYDVLDRCARPPGEAADADAACAIDGAGGLAPRVTTGSVLTQTRASALLGPFQGFTVSVSRGEGARNVDPQYVTQGGATPYAKITATEGGVAYAKTHGDAALSARSTFFHTRVARDVVFSQTEGRGLLTGGTTRAGWSGYARASWRALEASSSVTLVRATFDATGDLVPYAPPLVHRTDAVLRGELPVTIAGHQLTGSLASGLSVVGPRPLPLGEVASPFALLDGAARLGWGTWELGVTGTNLLGRRYRQAEYNYTSDFRGASYPTLVPARHFVAGEPRAVFVSISARLEDAP
ncbi:MAG: TonB family protein [Polyangiaceae bacterium]|nr:TonB family protein [Polyangiaceae bacterium]